MQNETEFLSIETIPYFIKLVTLYNKSLEELMNLYHSGDNEAAFSQLLDHLVDDFNYYQASFEHWQGEAKNEADRARLEALAPLLEEAKKLISQAARLIQH